MDNNNWRPAQGDSQPNQLQQQQQQQQPQQVSVMDMGGDWRLQLQMESRQRIVSKIMDTLKRHLPFSGQEGILELQKIAIRFEEKIYAGATSQPDYLRKISMKMLTMETKSQNQGAMTTSLPSNSAGNGKNPPDPASQNMQSLVNNQGQSIPIPLPPNQSQARQQILSQNIQNNNIVPTGIQSSAGIQSTMPSVTNLNQSQMPNVVGQSPNVHNISSVSQNIVGNSMGQAGPSTVFANGQRQIQGRQHVNPQQHSSNPHYLYQQQQQFQQQQLLKPNFQQGSMQHSVMQPHAQQQPQQQNLIQSNQLQSSQQSVMQTSSALQSSGMQPAPLSALQQNQQPAQTLLQQHPQSVLRQQPSQQTPNLHQQQTPMMQQPMLSSQQLIGQQPNATNMQQNQLIGHQTSITDMQQQQRLLSQPNNLPNLQQQQQLIAQQNNPSNIHQPQLGSQGNPSGSQPQQQLLGGQSGNSGMQTNQNSLHIQQSKIALQQQAQQLQNASNLVASQGQQPQQPQQQLMSQIQSQLPQHLGMQQQQTSLQQQRLQTSNAMLQPHSGIEQQKQLFQSQRNLQEASSTSLDSTAQTGNATGGDWQEEVYQKVQTMKDMYYQDLMDMYQKIATKLQQHDTLPHQPKTEQLEKLKMFKTMLERIITYLQVTKNNITTTYKEKLGTYEKQIISFLNTNRPRKPLSMQQGQFPSSQMHSMQQSQQTQSQNTQVQPHETQANPQLQAMNSQGSVATMQQNNVINMQHGSIPSLPVVPNAPALGSVQQVAVGSLHQNPVSASNQTTMNTFSQGGVNVLQPHMNTLQSNSNMLQHQQQLKQQQEQILQAQHKQQFQQRQMMQKQQTLQQQQLNQQEKQQPAQSQAHQMTQLHQMNDRQGIHQMNDRQGMAVRSGIFQPQHAASQRAAFQQQLKPGGTFPISSTQILQAPSPQIHQHASPQIDQQSMLSSLTKSVTPLQSSGHSPLVVPSPQTPVASSPMHVDLDKHGAGISSLTNAGNRGHQQVNGVIPPSLAIGTPGISASPLLAEFSAQDGNALTIISGKSSVTELPIERLIRAVKSASPNALAASVSDIGSVVSMVDRIAGSAPGNGSRATVGEDLVAMTKCRLQARNFITQDGSTGTKKMRRHTSAMPLVVVSSAGSVNDGFKQFTGAEASELESTATSSIKRPRIEVHHALMEEIKQINQRLIDTVVDVSDEDFDRTATAAEGGEGTIVKCTYVAVALCPSLKLQYAQMSPIQPLRLLVPKNYPNCSPVLLDKFPLEASKEHEDFSAKAKSKFSISLRSLSQPMSLGEIAKTWDICARAVLTEYAQQSGGSTFSSMYGTWENVLTT